MKNTADVTGGKPIAVLLQSISVVSAINPLDTSYDIHGGKREVLFFYFVPDTTRDLYMFIYINNIILKHLLYLIYFIIILYYYLYYILYILLLL
jgi:hypothetical protein